MRGARSVLTLVPESMPAEISAFYQDNDIQVGAGVCMLFFFTILTSGRPPQFFQCGVPGNKEPFIDIPDDKIALALTVLLDRRNHPILVHCNKVCAFGCVALLSDHGAYWAAQGKHRTGCLIGCLRKIMVGGVEAGRDFGWLI